MQAESLKKQHYNLVKPTFLFMFILDFKVRV
jgi:hypothetical protein